MTPKYKIQVIIIAVLFLTVNLFATNYFVRKSGNDGNDGLSPSTAWKTVTKAAQYALSPGDTVFIGAGDYWVLPAILSFSMETKPANIPATPEILTWETATRITYSTLKIKIILWGRELFSDMADIPVFILKTPLILF
jgi:hypothetical protein